MSALSQAQEEYIALLSERLNELECLASVHNCACPEKIVNAGVSAREKIRLARQADQSVEDAARRVLYLIDADGCYSNEPDVVALRAVLTSHPETPSRPL